VSGLLDVNPSFTYNVRNGFSPARTNKGIGPYALNPHLPITGASLNGLSNLSDLSGSNQQIAHTAAATAYTLLSTLAITDPEPITKAILAIAALVTGMIINVFSGCGNSCIQATHVVDKVEAEYLKPLLDKWQSMPVKYYSVQQAMLKVFDDAWEQILRGCSDPALGDAGKRCISERQRGGTSKWCPNCNWFTLYRDPIANDPNVVPDPIPEEFMNSGNDGYGGGYDGPSTSTSTSNSFDINSKVGGVPVWVITLGGIGMLLLSSSSGGRGSER
jgi:hypothetical protein